MKILHAAGWGLTVSCLIAIGTPPARAQDQASCARPGLVLDMIPITHTLVPYPIESQRHNEQGLSIFSVSIGPDGIPKDVAVTRSNASQRLNDAAMEHIKAHWRWQPPMQDCQPATAQRPVTVVWNLVGLVSSQPEPDFHLKMPLSAYPPGALEKLIAGSPTLLEIETDAQGVVTGGRVIDTSGSSRLDDQALAIVKNSPALLKGQDAGKHVISADWNFPPPESYPPNNETVIVTGRAGGR